MKGLAGKKSGQRPDHNIKKGQKARNNDAIRRGEIPLHFLNPKYRNFMERIFKAIDNNPEAIHYKIVDKAGIRKASGSSDDPDSLKEEIETAIDYLEDGVYKVLLGKANSVTERTAAVVVDYRKGEARQAPSRAQGRFTAAVSGFTLEDINQAKEEGRAEGLKELRVMRLEDKYTLLERRFDRFEDAFNRLVKTLDEADGEKDGKFLDKGLEAIEKLSAAKDLMSSFKF